MDFFGSGGRRGVPDKQADRQADDHRQAAAGKRKLSPEASGDETLQPGTSQTRDDAPARARRRLDAPSGETRSEATKTTPAASAAAQPYDDDQDAEGESESEHEVERASAARDPVARIGGAGPSHGGPGRGGHSVHTLFGPRFRARARELDEESEDESDEDIEAKIRSASEDQLGALYRKHEDNFGDVLQERRAGLDILGRISRQDPRPAVEQMESHALADALIAAWIDKEQPDVLAALQARKAALAAGAVPGDATQIVARVAQLALPGGDGEDGCELRADRICRDLAAAFPAIAPAGLSKIWTFPKSASQPLHPVHRWKHHVAPCVRLADGARLVFDRVLLSGGPGSVADWLQPQHLAPGEHWVVERPWEIASAPPHPDRPDPRGELGLLGLTTPL